MNRSTTIRRGWRDLLASGIRAMKIWPFDDLARRTWGQHISAEELEYGVSRFRAIREAVGDSIEIALEGHCQWNLPSAIRIAQAVEPYRPMWLEELMPPDSPQATRQLRESTRTPLVTSERLMTRWGVRPVIEQQAADIVMFDLDWAGGLTEGRKIAALAETFQLPGCAAQPGWSREPSGRRAFLRQHVQLVHDGKRAGFLSVLVR